MTVKEVINLLTKCDQDSEVIVFNNAAVDSRFCGIDKIVNSGDGYACIIPDWSKKGAV